MIVFVGRLIFFANAKKENMVTALTTEGDNPVIKANTQRQRTISIDSINLLNRIRFNGLNKNKRIKYSIPTCNPETAKICIAPAAA